MLLIVQLESTSRLPLNLCWNGTECSSFTKVRASVYRLDLYFDPFVGYYASSVYDVVPIFTVYADLNGLQAQVQDKLPSKLPRTATISILHDGRLSSVGLAG